MFILVFFLVISISQYITNKILGITNENNVGYAYSKRDSFIILGFLACGVILQLLPLKGHKLFWTILGIYGFAILLTMIILATIKKVIVEKQREEIQQVFDVLLPTLPKNAELDFNNPPFKLEYDGHKINKIIIEINPNTFKESVAINLCLSLNKFLPDYEWVNEFDFASRECAFVGTPLPPHVAKYKGSWLRPAEFIPIGLSGLGEVSWNINSYKNEGRSLYKYEDGKIAQTVDNPTAPQALVVGGPLGLNTIIPTTKGYKTMNSIQIGDIVFGLNNKLSKVIEVHDIHMADTTYELIFSNSTNTIKVISDEIHRFPVITRPKISDNDNTYFKPTHCKDLYIGDIIEGTNNHYLLVSKQKIDNQLVRCITVDNEEHLFKIVNSIDNDWNGGTEFNLPSLFTYNTGGGKAIYINQEVELFEE